MKRIIKPILGIGLLGLVLSQLDVPRLFELSRSIQWPWCLAALVLSTLNAVVSARRWGKIAGDLGVVITPSLALGRTFRALPPIRCCPEALLAVMSGAWACWSPGVP